MNKYIDLHFHSVHSEGILTVKQLLTMAKKNQVGVLSLTDHNSISGVATLFKLAGNFGIEVLSGVEIYVRYKDKPLHLLGYNFPVNDPKLTKVMKKLQQENVNNIKKSVQTLQQQGFEINTKDIFKKATCNYGVIHLIWALEKSPENIKKMNQEVPPDKQGFFDKIDFYLGQGTPAHFPLVELPIKQAIDIIKQCGGFTSLAHPGQQLNYEQDRIILELKHIGLDGIEVLSPYHTWHQVEHYQNLALKNDFIMTGGSDYHSDIDFSKEELIHRQWDYFKVPYSFYKNIKLYLNGRLHTDKQPRL